MTGPRRRATLGPVPLSVGRAGEEQRCWRSRSRARDRSGKGWAGPGSTIPSWEVVGEASAVAGRDLSRLLLEADQDELTLTANAQLATYVLGLVVLDAIERVGIEPTACAGHSLGEYTALTAAGALGFEDGVRLVVERGEAMHHAAEERPGTMAAVPRSRGDDGSRPANGPRARSGWPTTTHPARS